MLSPLKLCPGLGCSLEHGINDGSQGAGRDCSSTVCVPKELEGRAFSPMELLFGPVFLPKILREMEQRGIVGLFMESERD